MCLTELLSVYLPIDRLQAIVAGRALPRATHGVVLFADISGFTPLTERLLNEAGPHRGGEELTRHLNAVYGALIDEVHRFRGSVIGFSGDAITCWFEGDHEGTAVTCGLHLQKVMRAFRAIKTPSGTTLPLGIKVAIASGPAGRFAVGNADIQLLDVLTGAVLERVGCAEALAGRGEVIVDEMTAEQLTGSITISEWRSTPLGQRFGVVGQLAGSPAPTPWPRIPVEALDPNILRPWLLPSIYERLRSGQGDFLAELRQAVALFLRFDGIQFDSERPPVRELDAYIRWTQGIIDRYGGAMIQLTTGDKGSYLYAAFGAPVAHEDVVDRALSAALVLRSPPSDLPFTPRTQIGISAGRMRTGAYGSAYRRTYGVLGDETNVAARLMMKASPGQILVSERVAGGARAYEFRALGNVPLKGKTQALALFELTGRARKASTRTSNRPAPFSPIVGRRDERALLHRAVDELCSGVGGTVLIEGEAGIGKSRLTADMLGYARTMVVSSVRSFATGTDPIEHATTYYAWRPIFAELFGIAKRSESSAFFVNQDAMRAEVYARLPDALVPLAPLLEPVLEIELPDTPASAQLKGNARAAKTPSYLAKVFATLVGSRPVLLLLEDAHWLDSASWTLLEAVRREVPLLLSVVTTRPLTTSPDIYLSLRRSASTKVIVLEAMSPAEATALACRRLAVRELPESVAAFIQRKAEGNPFFTEELGYALREAGLIRVEDGVCHLDQSLEDLRFPDTIEGVVTSRIDRLAPAEQLTLKVASVVGRVFYSATLQELYPVVEERDKLPSYLHVLDSLGLTPRHSDDLAYVFKHAVTLDVSYNLMLFEQRRALHAALADWYERTYAADLTPYVPLLAHHRVRAIEGLDHPDKDALRRAIDALTKAGTLSLERGATPEALTHLSEGLRLLQKLPPSRAQSALELELRSLRGAALTVVRGPTHAEVREEFLRARRLCHELGETSRLFEAIFGIWYSHVTGSDRAGSLEFSQQLLDIALSSGVPAQLFMAHHARGATAVCAGQHGEGRAHMRSALAITKEATGMSGGLAHARDPLVMVHCYCAWANWFLGFPASSLDDVEKAIELAREVAHPLTLTQALTFGALVRRYRREPEAAEEFVRRAHALASEHGFPYWLSVTSSVRGWLTFERGDPAGAVLLLESTMERDREAGVLPLSTIIAEADLVCALTQLGRFDEAMAAVERGKAMLETRLAGFGGPELLRREAEMWLARRDELRAEASFRRALAMAEDQEARSLSLRAAMGLSTLLHARGKPATEPLRTLLDWFTEGFETPDLVAAHSLLAGIDRTDAGQSAP